MCVVSKQLLAAHGAPVGKAPAGRASKSSHKTSPAALHGPAVGTPPTPPAPPIALPPTPASVPAAPPAFVPLAPPCADVAPLAPPSAGAPDAPVAPAPDALVPDAPPPRSAVTGPPAVEQPRLARTSAVTASEPRMKADIGRQNSTESAMCYRFQFRPKTEPTAENWLVSIRNSRRRMREARVFSCYSLKHARVASRGEFARSAS
jgi:hypothetical protein